MREKDLTSTLTTVMQSVIISVVFFLFHQFCILVGLRWFENTKFKSKYHIPINTKDYKIVNSVNPVNGIVRKLRIGIIRTNI